MRKLALTESCCWFVIALCIVVLAGWQFDVILLRRLLPHAPQTTPLSALMLLALGAALMISQRLLTDKVARRWIWVCQGLSGAAMLAALWVGVQYLFNLGSSIEIALYPRLVTQNGGVFPGRPSPQTTVSVILVGCCIGLSPATARRSQRLVMLLALMGMLLPWLALFGYASTTNLFYALPTNPQTGISPLTAIGFLTLEIGVLGLRPHEGLIGLLTAPSSGGQMVRRLLPIVLVVPILFGWVVTYGRGSGFFDTATSFALSWGVTSLLFAALVIWQGTILHQYDTRLKFQSEALERSNIDLQQFAYIASHDLQAPLRSISGFTQLLQQTYDGQLSDEANDWIDRTVASTNQMQAMINDILAYSRVDSRARPFEPVPLSDVFSQAQAMLATSIRDANATVTRDELPTVMGDRSQLVQLLQNLIGNGLKYQGDQAPRVHITSVKKEGAWVIAVQDNGIGIEPQYQERIFEIFRRLHTQKEYPGTGIGLAICRQVVERHGGKIGVTSVPGRGSTFYFTIPFRR
ncbi:MAG: hypothetical protein KME45_08165 [Stenomitos rutilans HA7619-LM2]|jgi:signal transduction histidine kinase|nr:hypothetical protein [Stenomitos rutilans HA7619-LM2]